MEERINRRGVSEYFVRYQHLKLDDLRVAAGEFGLQHNYLYIHNIPEYPRPEIHVSHLKHDTDVEGLFGIREDCGFRSLDDRSLLWWGLAVGPEEVRSAEERLLRTIFPHRTEQQAQEQGRFLDKFATSPAFLKTSRLGSYRFTFSVEEVLRAYSEQVCYGAQPVLQVYETVLYKKEVMYVVLVSREQQTDHLLEDVPSAVCVYRDGRFIWRPEAMCNTHRYHMDYCQMKAVQLFGQPWFYVWDNVAIALKMEEGQVLRFDPEGLRRNVSFCAEGSRALAEFQDFDEAEMLVQDLWSDSAPLQRGRPVSSR